MNTLAQVVDPRGSKVAEFSDKDKYRHWDNTEGPDNCIACHSALLVVRPIEVVRGPGGYVLVDATFKLPDEAFLRVYEDIWLGFPWEHVETFDEMPDDWTARTKAMTRTLRRTGRITGPINIADNVVFDFGNPENAVDRAKAQVSGRRIRHAHTWFIGGRGKGESGLLSENAGHANMLMSVKQFGITVPTT